MKVEHEVSERGFVHWTPVETTYGHRVKVYESSAAQEPCMWLAVGIGEGAEEVEQCAHLTYEQAMQVRGRITAWLERHRELGARQAADRYAAELAAELGVPWEAPAPAEER